MVKVKGIDLKARCAFTDVQEMAFRMLLSHPQAMVLAGGAGFGGKSHWERGSAVRLAGHLAAHGTEKPIIWLGCAEFEALRDRHISALATDWSDLGRYMPSDAQHGKCFRFHNPHLGVIRLRHAQDMGSKRGDQVDAGFFDELTEMANPEFLAHFLYIVRRPNPLGINPTGYATNPDGPGYGWVKELWRPDKSVRERIKPLPSSSPLADTINPEALFFQQFLPTDNPLFDEQRFWHSVALLPKDVQMARRYGIWDSPEGARFKGYNEDIHCFDMQREFPRGFPDHWPLVISVDFGKKDPCAVYWTRIDEEGRAWTFQEFYRPGLLASQQIDVIKDMTPERPVDLFVGDPAMFNAAQNVFAYTGYSVADEYRKGIQDDLRFQCGFGASFRATRAQMFAKVEERLNRKGGPNGWRIEYGCGNLRRELQTAVYPKTIMGRSLEGDIDKKSADHALTAMAYGFYPLEGRAPAVHNEAQIREQEANQAVEANRQRLQALVEQARRQRR